jgi:hypothetical protein
VNGIKDFFGSEKGIWGFLLPMLGATAMLVGGEVDAQQWMDFAKVMTGIYVSGKTFQGIGAKVVDSRAMAKEAREDREVLEEKLAANDEVIDKLLAELAAEKRLHADTPPEG